jgi:uncharacterized protein YciI
MMLTYLVTLTIVVDRAIYEPHLPDHLAHLAQLKAAGHLLLSGPATDRTGGFVLLRADSLEHAHALAQADPLVARGLDRYEVREWRITNGDPNLIILS